MPQGRASWKMTTPSAPVPGHGLHATRNGRITPPTSAGPPVSQARSRTACRRQPDRPLCTHQRPRGGVATRGAVDDTDTRCGLRSLDSSVPSANALGPTVIQEPWLVRARAHGVGLRNLRAVTLRPGPRTERIVGGRDRDLVALWIPQRHRAPSDPRFQQAAPSVLPNFLRPSLSPAATPLHLLGYPHGLPPRSSGRSGCTAHLETPRRGRGIRPSRCCR